MKRADATMSSEKEVLQLPAMAVSEPQNFYRTRGKHQIAELTLGKSAATARRMRGEEGDTRRGEGTLRRGFDDVAFGNLLFTICVSVSLTS
eukprot:2211010-Rhodomonas_salina.1